MYNSSKLRAIVCNIKVEEISPETNCLNFNGEQQKENIIIYESFIQNIANV